MANYECIAFLLSRVTCVSGHLALGVLIKLDECIYYTFSDTLILTLPINDIAPRFTE